MFPGQIDMKRYRGGELDSVHSAHPVVLPCGALQARGVGAEIDVSHCRHFRRNLYCLTNILVLADNQGSLQPVIDVAKDLARHAHVDAFFLGSDLAGSLV